MSKIFIGFILIFMPVNAHAQLNQSGDFFVFGNSLRDEASHVDWGGSHLWTRIIIRG